MVSFLWNSHIQDHDPRPSLCIPLSPSLCIPLSPSLCIAVCPSLSDCMQHGVHSETVGGKTKPE